MTDDDATEVVKQVLDLAMKLRDEGPLTIAHAARGVIAAAGGDPVAALTVAAALIRVDAPVDRWWQEGLTRVGADRFGAPEPKASSR